MSVPVVPVRCSRKSSIRDRATMLATITRVLETASRPLRAREVHAAGEQLAGESLRWTSVKAALAAGASGRRPCFQRVHHGVYQLAGRKDVR